MVRRCYQERSLFECLLPDGEKLWSPELRRIDELLSDAAVIDLIVAALQQRWPQSARRGRPGTPAEVVVRMLILKHLFDWSYDELEYEVRANLAYRAFARVGMEKTPDAKTILRIARVLGPETMQELHQRVVQLAIQARVSRGRRLRIDTTVVETNIHHPLDSSQLADGIRVITRRAKKVGQLIGSGTKRFRDSVRSTARIAASMRMLKNSLTRKQQLRAGYRKLVQTARRVVRDAEQVGQEVSERLQQGIEMPQIRRRLQQLRCRLGDYLVLLGRVIEQTVARVFAGDIRHPDKVLSIFEPHTEAIRKGKLLKPTEFGKMVVIQEADGGLVTDYQVEQKRVADTELWQPAIQKHIEVFGHAPYLATADRGFYSSLNEKTAGQLGVQRVCLPRSGKLSEKRRSHQRQRWFRAGLRWRTGSEGRISALKQRGMRRCRYRGKEGMHRCVGFGVIVNNLLAIGRHRHQQPASCSKRTANPGPRPTS